MAGKMKRWKVNRRMVVLGTVFGAAATLTGMFLLRAVEGGFAAEGFFLIVLSWVFVPVLLLMIVRKLLGRPSEDDDL